MNILVGNTLFKNRTSHLVTFESGPSKTQVDFYLARRNQNRFFKDLKVLPHESCITQHKLFVCDFNITGERKFVTRKKIWKLYKGSLKNDFRLYINKYSTSNQKDAFVEGCWNVLNEALLETTDRSCGWTKKTAIHKQTWCRNNGVCNGVSEKWELWKEWKKGNASKKKYLEADKKYGRTVNRPNVKEEGKDLKALGESNLMFCCIGIQENYFGWLICKNNVINPEFQVQFI